MGITSDTCGLSMPGPFRRLLLASSGGRLAGHPSHHLFGNASGLESRDAGSLDQSRLLPQDEPERLGAPGDG